MRITCGSSSPLPHCIVQKMCRWPARLNDYLLFYVPLKNFPLIYGDIIIFCEGMQTLDLCSALRAFEQEGIFIVSHLVFPVSTEGLSHLIASFDSQRDAEDFVTCILTGPHSVRCKCKATIHFFTERTHEDPD
jgi:hypothetical protein